MAALFGMLLAAAGEAIRRKAVPGIQAAYSNAMIPGVLTAAASLTLFGVVFAAYGVYEYIGPTAAFILLALVAFATLGLSLLHGQALAGLGLFGSMITPALIVTETPNIWALFGFLTVSWTATTLAARYQRWLIVPALANIGLGLWVLATRWRRIRFLQSLSCSQCSQWWRAPSGSGLVRLSNIRRITRRL